MAVPTNLNHAMLCTHAVADLAYTIGFPVMGVSVGGSNGTLCSVTGVTTMAGTSVIALRRASTCTSATPGCVDTAHDPLFQVPLCGSEAATTPFALNNNLAYMTYHTRDCSTYADIRKFMVRIYYVSPQHLAGDGIPTLFRLELVNGALTPVALVEGIQAMVLRYGVDVDGDGNPDLLDTNGDSTPDTVYVDDPAVSCAAGDLACSAANWHNVVTVRISLLVRAVDKTPQYRDEKTYDLSGTTFGPFHDGYKRHVYTSVVRLNNVSARREE
jgi:type IV pilus assembly protein PilW